MNEESKLARGQVWKVKFGEAIGCEQAATRPAVIVSSDFGCDTSPVVTVVYLTSAPRNIGVVVELDSLRTKSWAICNQINTIDRSRLMVNTCNLRDYEMNRIDLALRKALALPAKDEESADRIIELEEEIKRLEEKISELELDNVVHKRLYGKAIEKIIELKLDKDTRMEVSVHEPEPEPVVEDPIVEEPLDLSGLKEKFKVYEEKLEKKRVGARVRADFVISNINKDDAQTIHEKTGLGLMTAQEIVRYRKKHGEFKDVSDLVNVPRFGNGCFKRYVDRFEV